MSPNLLDSGLYPEKRVKTGSGIQADPLRSVEQQKEDTITRQKNVTYDGNGSQATFEAMLREQLQQAERTALISVLEAEVDSFIGVVRYERNEQRRDYRNGH
jgi:hypothetical protein